MAVSRSLGDGFQRQLTRKQTLRPAESAAIADPKQPPGRVTNHLRQLWVDSRQPDYPLTIYY
jgi:hypothetical protein